MKRVFWLLLAVFALLIPMGAGAAGTPVLGFSGGSGDYGTVDLGATASQTFALTNSGGVATASLKVSITGAGAAAFKKTMDSCSATSLGPKKVCSITVAYTPTSVHADDNATLTAMSKKPDASLSLTLTGRGTNHAAVAGDDFVTTSEDTQLIFPKSQVLANDTDVDGDILHVQAGSETNTHHGILSISGTSFFYTPAHDFNGTDSFTYRAADAFFGSVSNVATVTITVTPVNDAPVAGPNPYVTNEDTALTLPAPGVLAGDTDPDGDVLHVARVNGSATDVGKTVTLASGALLTVNADGSFSFDPNGAFDYLGEGETAPLTFTYTATDGLLESNLTTLIVTVLGVNDAPPPPCSVKNTTTNVTYTDLQAALDGASAAGDELDITGNCTGNYVVVKDITLKGIDHGGVQSTLDGNATGRVVTVGAASTASIDNLRITNGKMTAACGCTPDGGGIHNAGTLTISGSTITQNTSDERGGGIFTSGPLTVTDSEISHNVGVRGGALGSDFQGVVVYPAVGMVSLTDTVVSDNTAWQSGGGIHAGTETGLVLLRTSVAGNTAFGAFGTGGGIFTCGTCTLSLTDSTITGNTAHDGGGLNHGSPLPLTSTNSTVSGNLPDNCLPDNIIPGCV